MPRTSLGFGVWGLGVVVWSLGVEDRVSGCEVYSEGFGVSGLELKVETGLSR